jgi:hypothetical protein
MPFGWFAFIGYLHPAFSFTREYVCIWVYDDYILCTPDEETRSRRPISFAAELYPLYNSTCIGLVGILLLEESRHRVHIYFIVVVEGRACHQV